MFEVAPEEEQGKQRSGDSVRERIASQEDSHGYKFYDDACVTLLLLCHS